MSKPRRFPPKSDEELRIFLESKGLRSVAILLGLCLGMTLGIWFAIYQESTAVDFSLVDSGAGPAGLAILVIFAAVIGIPLAIPFSIFFWIIANRGRRIFIRTSALIFAALFIAIAIIGARQDPLIRAINGLEGRRPYAPDKYPNQLIAAGPRAVGPLIKAVKNDGRQDVRRRAIEILGDIGEPSRSVIPDLLRIAEPGDNELSFAARETLLKIAPDDPRVSGAGWSTSTEKEATELYQRVVNQYSHVGAFKITGRIHHDKVADPAYDFPFVAVYAPPERLCLTSTDPEFDFQYLFENGRVRCHSLTLSTCIDRRVSYTLSGGSRTDLQFPRYLGADLLHLSESDTPFLFESLIGLRRWPGLSPFDQDWARLDVVSESGGSKDYRLRIGFTTEETDRKARWDLFVHEEDGRIRLDKIVSDLRDEKSRLLSSRSRLSGERYDEELRKLDDQTFTLTISEFTRDAQLSDADFLYDASKCQSTGLSGVYNPKGLPNKQPKDSPDALIKGVNDAVDSASKSH